jgi:hypothetical protein
MLTQECKSKLLKSCITKNILLSSTDTRQTSRLTLTSMRMTAKYGMRTSDICVWHVDLRHHDR